MHILVVEDCPTEGPLLTRVLENMGHDATLVRTSEEALKAVKAKAPDILVTDLVMPGMSGLDFVLHLRALELGHYVYVIMRTGRDTEQSVHGAFSAGVDDFIPKKRTLDEFKSRIRAGERIVRLEVALRDRIQHLESALRRLDVAASLGGAAAVENVVLETPPSGARGPNGDHGIAGMATWRALPASLGAVLGQALQAPYAGSPALPTELESCLAATIRLNDIVHNLEVCITVACDEPTLAAISQDVLGDADPEIMRDFLSEIANLSMGAVKANFIKEGCTFTGGLPKVLAKPSVESLLESYPSRLCLSFDSDERKIWMLVGARSIGRIKVAVPQLREGMVLAEDVLGPGNVLLIRAGSRMTESLAERLRKLVPQLVVELADPKAA